MNQKRGMLRQDSARASALGKYVPRTRPQRLLLCALVLSSAHIVWWMWDSIMIALAHWHVVLVGIGFFAFFVVNHRHKHTRASHRIVKHLRQHPKGLTVQELMNALNMSNVVHCEKVIQELLEAERVRWIQCPKRGMCLHVKSASRTQIM